MVPIVGDDVGEHLQGPWSISKYGNLSKNSQIITKKYKWFSLLMMMMGYSVQGPGQHPNKETCLILMKK